MSLNSLFKVPNPVKQFPRIDLNSIVFLPDKPQMLIICDDTVCIYSFSAQDKMATNPKHGMSKSQMEPEAIEEVAVDKFEMNSSDLRELELLVNT